MSKYEQNPTFNGPTLGGHWIVKHEDEKTAESDIQSSDPRRTLNRQTRSQKKRFCTIKSNIEQKS